LLRQLADLTSLSTLYLSQLERGTHQPAVRMLKLISRGAVFLILACATLGTRLELSGRAAMATCTAICRPIPGEHQEAAGCCNRPAVEPARGAAMSSSRTR
jgi:transcriptional regulator with XRE-family HTH domain